MAPGRKIEERGSGGDALRKFVDYASQNELSKIEGE